MSVCGCIGVLRHASSIWNLGRLGNTVSAGQKNACKSPEQSAAAVRRLIEQLLHRNVKWFRGGLVFKAHRLCVSLNSRLASNKEEEERVWGFYSAANSERRGNILNLLPKRQGQNLALTDLCVPCSLDSGRISCDFASLSAYQTTNFSKMS